MEKLVSGWYSDAAWVTSMNDDGEGIHTMIVYRNLNPLVQVCEDSLRDALTLPASWDIL